LATLTHNQYCHEKIKIHRVLDCFCPPPGRDRNQGGRGLPQDGYQRGDLLQLEEKVWRARPLRAATATSARGGKQPAEEAGGRPVPGQTYAAGGAQKKAIRPARPRWLIDQYRVSERRVAQVTMLARSTFRYQPVERNDEPLRARIREIAMTRVRYGFWRIYVLLRREGWMVNHKRVYHLYKLEGLNLRAT